jgi:DNA invertase Pin-like site-specific DNA recombinase
MRAILYSAKSTEDKHGSIPDQLKDGRRLAAERAYTIAGEYSDEAKSAYHGNRGPGLAAAMSACEAISAQDGRCSLIVQRSDRLARGDGKHARSLVEIVLWAIRHDIDLLSVMDPEILAGGDLALLMGAIGHMKAHGESDTKSRSVKKGIARRAARGDRPGGSAPVGYMWQLAKLVIDAAQAPTIRLIFDSYTSGMGQRAIVRLLAERGIRTPAGSFWHQSAVSRVLGNPTYAGLLPIKGDEGQWLTGSHEPIVSAETWQQTQAIKTGALRRRSGRHADGAHLLVRGILRCSCGAAMLPRKARPGVERERYVCSGRIADPSSCSQQSVRRELIDGPLLATLLDRHIDLEATQARIAERMTAAVAESQQTVAEAESDAAGAEAKLARVRGHYQEGRIEPEDWAEQRPVLTAELEAAKQALSRAQAHAQQVAQQGPVGDAEQKLLDHLSALKAAVASGMGEAPNLHALRNVIAELFTSFDLIAPARERDPYVLLPAYRIAGPGRFDVVGPQPLPVTERGPIDSPRTVTSPTGHDTPNPPEQSYPPGFLARYCWW